MKGGIVHIFLFLSPSSDLVLTTDGNETLLGGLLAADALSGGALSCLGLLIGLVNSLLLLAEDELNVGGMAGVLADAAVGTVGSPAAGGGLVALGMGDVEGVNVEALGLGVGVGEHVLDDGRGLDGPPTLGAGGLGLLGLGLAADATGVLDEGDDGLEGEDVLEELHGLVDGHAVDVVSDLTAVLEVHTEVGSAGLGVGDSGIGLDSVMGHDEKVLIQKYTNTDCWGIGRKEWKDVGSENNVFWAANVAIVVYH